MTEHKKFEVLFKSHKTEIPDAGFSRDTARKLPARAKYRSITIMYICSVAGLAAAAAAGTFDMPWGQIFQGAGSVQSVSGSYLAVFTIYIAAITLSGAVSYALYSACLSRK